MTSVPLPQPPATGRPLARGALARTYAALSLAVLLVSLAVLGWWVSRQIEVGVVHRAAAATALYVENFIVTQVQELDHARALPPQRTAAIERLLADTPLGREIVAIKIWGPDGRVVYGDNAGQTFDVKGEQSGAWRGEVVADLTNLTDPENADLRPRYGRLLEIYTPIRLEGSDRVLAVAEFYQRVDALDGEVRATQRRSWAVVALVFGLTYLLLSGLVRRGSDTIDRQSAELRRQVTRLEGLLTQNRTLSERVRRAARRSVAVNEDVLRRVAQDLHDGPAQDVGVALLRLDRLEDLGRHLPPAEQAQLQGTLEALTHCLTSALGEMRSLAQDLRLPDVDHLDVAAVVERAVREHRRRTGTDVHVEIAPDVQTCPVPLGVRMAAYRIVQEALNNAYRHAGGRGQRVSLSLSGADLTVEVGDDGPGGTLTPGLGLGGMRERAESLGGHLSVTDGRPGVRVVAQLPLAPEVDDE
ncbi:sensor histidine kinase [Deinococcus radiotolerans]|uniref:Histidine kinase n=1 Tax=Deinococcus radiotolerans TaxID=1309407 RepID=A0ABQ2FIS8_9DEIO|nr:ATP-binding protein [Deinococcus radiotolerans]GGK99978.1 histidine kinase [Deinococcus radiotolerans]